ncbi:MAG: hypothetical protein ACRCS3_13725, partial [Paracoccaceae bacterium]
MRTQDFENWEVALIKAMKDSGRWSDQAIHAALSTPLRSFNSARLSKNEWPKISNRPFAAVTSEVLQRFEAQLAAFGRDQLLELYRGNRTVFQVDYHFMPVGQGLFTAGQVRVGNIRPFRWVFDCGTLSRKVNMQSVIAACPVVPSKVGT